MEPITPERRVVEGQKAENSYFPVILGMNILIDLDELMASELRPEVLAVRSKQAASAVHSKVNPETV